MIAYYQHGPDRVWCQFMIHWMSGRLSVIIIQISLSRAPCKPLVALKARESVDFPFVFTISISGFCV